MPVPSSKPARLLIRGTIETYTDTVHARFARSQSARQTILSLPRKHGKLVDHRTENPIAPLIRDTKAFFCRESFIAWTEWTARQERCCLNPFPCRHKIATTLAPVPAR